MKYRMLLDGRVRAWIVMQAHDMSLTGWMMQS